MAQEPDRPASRQEQPPEPVAEDTVSAATARGDDEPSAEQLEPPSAGFIVQLFLLPAIIVGIIVLVWVAFGKIASNARKVEDYIQGLRSHNPKLRWTTAHELAIRLRNDRKLASDPLLAQQLIRLLEQSLQKAATAEGDEDDEVKLRVYLVRALGALRVGDPRAVLAIAARQDPVTQVRSFALWELAELLHERPEFAGDEQIEQALIAGADDSDPAVRRYAAYALGVAGTPKALEKLRTLLRDSDRETRYNAAAGLARNGDFTGIAVLVEMLTEPVAPARSDGEATKQYITEQALNAVKVGLKKAKPDDPQLRTAIERLARSTDNPRLRALARDVLLSL